MKKLVSQAEIIEEDNRKRLVFTNRDEFSRSIQYLKVGKYELTLEPHKNRRTTDQNNRYWAKCQAVAKQLSLMGCEGWTAEDVHELSKSECNPIVKLLVADGGEIVEKKLGGSTREMTTKEHNDYDERFDRYWSSKGIEVLDDKR
jgi:hypothetical protein